MKPRSTSKIAFFVESFQEHDELVRKIAAGKNATIIQQPDALIELFSQNRYDILLYLLTTGEKIRLPLLELILRAEPRLKILLLNGDSAQETIIEAFRLGITDYFATPVNIPMLIQRIDSLLDL